MDKDLVKMREDLQEEIEILVLENLKKCLIHKVSHVKSAAEWAEIYKILVETRKVNQMSYQGKEETDGKGTASINVEEAWFRDTTPMGTNR